MLYLSCKGTKYILICYEKIGGNLIALWPGGINLILICWNRSLSKSICVPKNFTQSSAEVLAEFRRVLICRLTSACEVVRWKCGYGVVS
jgi:hypothetical protein